METARKYQKEKAPLTKAIKECIEKDILADYLLKKSNEVINMLMAEYDYETDIEVQREEAANEARKSALIEGEKNGVTKGCKLLKQALLLRRAGKTYEEIAEQCGVAVEEVKDMLQGIE